MRVHVSLTRSVARIAPTLPTARGALVAGVVFLAACTAEMPGSGSTDTTPNTRAARTPVYEVDIVREYPHDRQAFTQGLLWTNGTLYESTGQVGQSGIRRVALQTGAVEQRRDLPPPHFGEGITILDGKLYQLTWTTGRAFVYNAATFAPIAEFSYEGEGWGLTTNGRALIMSDGTDALRLINPNDFSEIRRIPVSDNGVPVRNLNELEWVDGEVWANVWTTDRIARIDPESGRVVGWIDLTGLLPDVMRSGTEDVLNGIAYDAEAKRIFVTGKNWPRVFEIALRVPR